MYLKNEMSAREATRSDQRWEYFSGNIATGIGILYIHDNFDQSMGGEIIRI